MKKITILDSTLRDGAQGEGISYSVRDKLYILKALDEFGVDLDDMRFHIQPHK